jgi:hypothetical protein
MAGMEALGRVMDVVYTPLGNAISLRGCSGATIVAKASGSSALVLQAQQTFTGSQTNWTTANGFGQSAHWYQNTTNTGTAGWTKQTAVWTSNSLATAGTTGYVSVLEIYADQLAAGYEYLYLETATNCTPFLILHDLTVQRGPANLAALSA